MTSKYRTWNGPAQWMPDVEIWPLQRPVWPMWRRWWLAMGLVVLSVLTGCQTAPQGQQQSDVQAMLRDPRVQVAVACEGYATGMQIAASQITAGRVNSATVDRIKVIRTEIGPSCEDQSTVTDPVALVPKITAAATQITAALAVPPESASKGKS